MFIFLGKRLRRYTEMMDDLTLPDFFESRFKDKSNVLRILSVSIILIFMISIPDEENIVQVFTGIPEYI